MKPALILVMLTTAMTSLAAIMFTSSGTVFVDRILSGANPEWLMPMISIMLVLAVIQGIEDFEMILACRDAEIHDDILSRAGGYRCQVQPGGRNFSGGQLQRMEIAHALAMDPTLLILDEATSALDNVTQKHVTDSLSSLESTRIVVAHRLSTVQDCDRIFVVDKGRIAESGSYDELMKMNGIFAELVARQQLD